MSSNTNMAAFVKLCAVFEELSAGADVLEFELLPKALQGSDDEILRDGRCIGIPKPLLVQAFVIARGVVFDHDSQFDIGSNDVGKCFTMSSITLVCSGSSIGCTQRYTP